MMGKTRLTKTEVLFKVEITQEEYVMATTVDFIEYVCSQIDETYHVRYLKMFGEYMVYINEKPLLLVCDNTVFVKEAECLKSMMEEFETGFPYQGAKEHYIVDIDNRDLVDRIIEELERSTSVPVNKPRRKRKSAD